MHITDPAEMMQAFIKDKPKSVGFDTETTGLHIIRDVPFLIQLGWFPKVFTFEPTPDLMRAFFRICKSVKWVFAHNCTYDCHMLANMGYISQVEAMDNLCDVQAIMRLSLEAKSTRDGGDNLKLKDLGVKYIHPYAANSEEMVKAGLKAANADRVKVLAAALKQFPYEGELTDTGRQKYWGKGAIEKFMKNIVNDLSDLPENIREIWADWQEEYPEPTYADIDRDLMLLYAGEDVATTLMLAEYGMKVVLQRDQMKILKLERDCLLPKFRMERVGLKADLAYLEESRLKMKAYIIQLRAELAELSGEELTVGQSARIMELYEEKWGIHLESSDKKTMLQIRNNFDGEPKRFAEVIGKLRSAEKWYSTYIVNVQKNASYDGRAYTQINLNGAVSGRMSSNFQQFPKDAYKTFEGVELYHPRRAFLVNGGDYPTLTFIDLSQIELRSQAHYTLLTGTGDINLCRAYMPFKCTHVSSGEVYNYLDATERARWDEKQLNGESAWLLETGETWTPTDLHSMTASKAYPHIDMDSDEFQSVYRPKGKTTNFAANYGASWKALVDSLGISRSEAETLINGYNEAFPGVIAYQKAITKAHAKKGYVHNHYGRRYYLKDNSDAYKLANYVVQGTCADALKYAIVEIDALLLGRDSKLVLPIHDELITSQHYAELDVAEKIRQIMIKAFEWMLVPVDAGIDTTETNWREAG